MLHKETSCQNLMRDLWHFNLPANHPPLSSWAMALGLCSMCIVPQGHVPGVDCLRGGNMDLVKEMCVLTCMVAPQGTGSDACPCFTCLRNFSGLESDCQKHLRQIYQRQQLEAKNNTQGKQVTDQKGQERRVWKRKIHGKIRALKSSQIYQGIQDTTCPGLDAYSEMTLETPSFHLWLIFRLVDSYSKPI